MDIDWSEIAKKLSVRLSGTTLELEQWKHVAEKLFEQHEALKQENEQLKASTATNPDTQESSND